MNYIMVFDDTEFKIIGKTLSVDFSNNTVICEDNIVGKLIEETVK